jgi:hypothetical protein
MSIHKSLESAQKTMKSSAEKFTHGADQEAFQPMMENIKAWGDLVQEQAQASQAAVAKTLEAFKDIKEPQAVFEAMSAFAENITAMFAKNIKDAVALSVAQFKGNVGALENNLPASESVTKIANGLKNAASKMEDSVGSAVNDGTAAAKKARAE